MTDLLYLDELRPGMRFPAGPVSVSAAAIMACAAAFDPQPFHTDPAAACDTPFKGLAASGWHTACLTMRLLAQGGLPVQGGIIGQQVDGLRWLRPVRPDDTLWIDTEILAVEFSVLRPARGTLVVRTTTRNQREQVVQSFTARLSVACTPPAVS